MIWIESCASDPAGEFAAWLPSASTPINFWACTLADAVHHVETAYPEAVGARVEFLRTMKKAPSGALSGGSNIYTE